MIKTFVLWWRDKKCGGEGKIRRYGEGEVADGNQGGDEKLVGRWMIGTRGESNGEMLDDMLGMLWRNGDREDGREVVK